MNAWRLISICLAASAMVFATARSEAGSTSLSGKEKTQAAVSHSAWAPPHFEERQAERDKMVRHDPRLWPGRSRRACGHGFGSAA